MSDGSGDLPDEPEGTSRLRGSEVTVDDADSPAPDQSNLNTKLGEVPRWIAWSAALLGVLTVVLVGAAVTIATSGDSDGQSAQRTPAPDKTEPTPDKTTAASPLANLQCDGTFIVEIARADPPFEKSAVEDALAKTTDAKYLEAENSCSTYKAAGARLIAYLGPFDDLTAACEAQRKTNNLDAVPHHMDVDQRGRNYCSCEVDPPVLRVNDGADGDVATLAAIKEAQEMLKALGYFAPPITGDPFGPQTLTAVQAFQIDQGLPATGTINKQTWAALRQSTLPGGRRFC